MARHVEAFRDRVAARINVVVARACSQRLNMVTLTRIAIEGIAKNGKTVTKFSQF